MPVSKVSMLASGGRDSVPSDGALAARAWLAKAEGAPPHDTRVLKPETSTARKHIDRTNRKAGLERIATTTFLETIFGFDIVGAGPRACPSPKPPRSGCANMSRHGDLPLRCMITYIKIRATSLEVR